MHVLIFLLIFKSSFYTIQLIMCITWLWSTNICLWTRVCRSVESSQPEWNVPMVILRIIPFWRVSTVLAEVWIFIYFSPREGFTKLNVRINKDVKLYCAGFFLLVKYINYKYHSRSIFKRFPGRHQHVIKLFIFFLTQMSHAYHKCT